MFSEVVNLELVSLIVALQQRLKAGFFSRRSRITAGKVTVPMLAAGQALVEARKFVRDVVDLTLLHRAVLQVQIPPPGQRRIAAERIGRHLERLHPASVDNQRTVLLVRIEEVKNEERLVLEPFHVASLAVHHADLGAVLRLPDEDRFSRRRVLEMEHGRAYEEDRVVIRRNKIVHHHRQSGVDRPRLEELAFATRAVPGYVRRERLVAEEQQVAGDWIELRMRRYRAGQLAAEIEQAHGLKRQRLELVRRWGFEPRQQAAGISDDVSVAGVLEWRRIRWHLPRLLEQAAKQRPPLLHLGLEALGADVAIAISGAAIAQHNRMHNPVAVEPMVAAKRLEVRIRSNSVERTIELARQLAFDLEVERVALFPPRCIVAVQVWIV